MDIGDDGHVGDDLVYRALKSFKGMLVSALSGNQELWKILCILLNFKGFD